MTLPVSTPIKCDTMAKNVMSYASKEAGSIGLHLRQRVWSLRECHGLGAKIGGLIRITRFAEDGVQGKRGSLRRYCTTAISQAQCGACTSIASKHLRIVSHGTVC